ncbi:MAG: PKD domain-containing protein [Microbacterium sp.]|uniref:PKD domain-containing protein n=1 Tax=Microbacterium sp. TaxID=51671 RepID=UPI0039E3336B
MIVTSIGLVPSATAAEVTHTKVVSDDPANNTPHVLDGEVNSIAQVGNLIVLGGSFTQVSDAQRTQTYQRRNVVAFDATTGAISSFDPSPDNTVTTVIPSADGNSVYLGGSFNTVAGQTRRKLARVDIATGTNTSGFRNVAGNGIVKDLRLVGDRLWVAGAFTSMSGSAQGQLTTLNATSGATDGYMALTVAGTQNGGTTSVNKIDVTADGSRLVGIGNFLTVGGLDRRQIFMLDATGSTAAVANWQTDFYAATCSTSFDTYMRDLDFAPDGSFFVVSTTGAYRGATSPCDSQARFNTSRSGTGITPEWINTTGGDTTYAVEVTGSVVYVGGHFRWANNPFAADRAGAGAVARDGIAALDPANGMPLSWNPGRTRGVGVFDMLATETGLWVGSDTDRIGNNEYHGRIAYFPLSGGKDLPATNAPTLPAGVVMLGPTAGQNPSTSGVRLSEFSGTTVGRTAQSSGAIDWSTTRAAFMLNGNVYLAGSDGSFTRRSFDGTTWGAPVAVSTHDQLVTLTAWHTSAAKLTGAFFDNGRMYYTQTGDSALKMRYFTAENDVVGAAEYSLSSVTGLNLSQVRGMFLAGDWVFLAQADGSLVRVGWQSGAFVAGSVSTVSGPAIDGVNWQASALFAYQGVAGAALNFAPIAQASVDCVDQTCSFSSSGSSDEGGSIVSYSWDFGDGAKSTDANPTHAYAASGTYTVTLTLTDDMGATNTATLSKQVQFVDTLPEAAFTASCTNLECELDASASTDAEGALAGYSWTFGDDTTDSGERVSHTFPADGEYTVTLTVTDSAGQTAQSSQTLQVEHVFADPVAAYTVECDSLTCSFDASESSDADGPLADYAWDFGDGTQGAGAEVEHVFSGSGDYDVTLVVTDSQGAQATLTTSVSPVELTDSISYVGAVSTNRNATTHPLKVPSDAQVDDLMVMTFASNSTTATVSAPTGWTEVAASQSNGVTGKAWVKVVAAADLGKTFTPTSSSAVKADATLLVYRGVDAANPVVEASSVLAASSGSYTTPDVTAAQNGTLVSYWAVKSNVANVLTAPSEVSTRASSAGTGSGNITALAADSGPLVAGTAGGITSSVETAGNRAFLLSIALRPEG